LIEKIGQEYIVEFDWHPEVDFATILSIVGNTPIPPYLNRASELSDGERYQTIYAKENGSVAAPTAGLHFTQTIFDSLHIKNISTIYTTLHVGAGTFKPVKSEKIEGHEMHAEFIQVSSGFVEKLLLFENIVPVGTTSMRTIESIYWMGVKAYFNKSISIQELEITQWEIYDKWMQYVISKSVALEAFLNIMKFHHVETIFLKTQILIAPGYNPKIARGLITNFHQPQSTLLLLIAALVGEEWKRMYKHALENDFRFLSYGDGCYIKW
jgi:S-adenosylmethionine:tRNA ribosyltransferase-isomerase